MVVMYFICRENLKEILVKNTQDYMNNSCKGNYSIQCFVCNIFLNISKRNIQRIECSYFIFQTTIGRCVILI
jgi:hypothetical protein